MSYAPAEELLPLFAHARASRSCGGALPLRREGTPSPMPDWQAERDAALRKHEENERARFFEKAMAFALDYLATHGPATGEEITDACKAAGIMPRNDKAFGVVYLTLSRRGLIEKAGTAVRTKGHGCSGANVWRVAA